MNKQKLLGPLSFAFCLVSAPVIADSIPVVNFGFEDITGSDPVHFGPTGLLLDNHYSQYAPVSLPQAFSTPDAIPGWTYVGPGGAGTWNIPASSAPGEAPQGQNIAWMNLVGSIQQNLGVTIASGYRYSLSVQVGRPAGVPSTGFTIGLYNGSTPLAELSNSVLLQDGQFQPVTVSFDALPGSPYLGQALSVKLGTGGLNGGIQVDFDAVTVERVLLPEASTRATGLGLIVAFGLIGFYFQGRK